MIWIDEGLERLINIEYKYPDSNDLKIVVDTSEIIGSGMDGKNTYSMTNDDVRSYNFKGKYKSYPVFIENVSNDTLSIGFGNRIYPIVEAKDSLGNWRPIQKPGTYYCGTGLQSFYLEPNNILISSCKLYDGDFIQN